MLRTCFVLRPRNSGLIFRAAVFRASLFFKTQKTEKAIFVSDGTDQTTSIKTKKRVLYTEHSF
jgi:hypothetical protein